MQQPQNADGLQFVILSHDGLLEKYFDRLSGTTWWYHNKLQGSPPMGTILHQAQGADRLKTTIASLLSAGQVTQAEPLIRQYLEYKLQQIIRKVDIPVPIDFAIKDTSRIVSNCLDAITSAIELQKKAGTLVLDVQQVQNIDTSHVPAIVGNWVGHYETGAGSSLSAPALSGVIGSIDALAECFRYDDTSGGSTVRRWYRAHGKRRDLGLGSFPLVTLAEARQLAFDNRKLARAGGDPAALRSGRAVPTFAEAAETVIEIHAAGWKDGGKSEKQWRASLRDYAMPMLGRRRVSEITTADVMAVLLPIWSDKHETARRVRQRIGAVMKWGVVQGYRNDNPAGDAIGAALPRNGVVRKHQRALPHAEVGAALAKVRASSAYAATMLCFEFLTLCAVRSGEARLARWGEIVLEAAMWTVPAERMKGKREHRVPLSGRALEVLHEARELADGSGWVFPSPTGKALSDSTLSKLCRENDIGCVPHGMRSSFRDWAAECSDAPREVCELALAHVNSDRVEAAYRRTDLFERRRKLMDDWARYIEGGRHG